jgi:hypothetical protein
MPLLKYFGWVGSFLVAALFAANWCSSVPIARSRPSDVPLTRRINIRIHTDQKWPERVVFDTTRSMPTPDAKREAESDLGSSATLARAERQPFDAFALSPSARVFDRAAPPARGSGAGGLAAWKKRAISKSLAYSSGRGLTFPNPLHKPPGRN